GGIAWQLTQVGKIRVELGDREAARRDFERALVLHDKVGAKRDAAETHRELGNLFIALSQPADAEREFVAARAVYKAISAAPDEAWAALGEARAKAVQHDVAGALARAEEAVAIGDRTGDRELRVRARLARGAWLREDGRQAEARAANDEALKAAG